MNSLLIHVTQHVINCCHRIARFKCHHIACKKHVWYAMHMQEIMQVASRHQVLRSRHVWLVAVAVARGHQTGHFIAVTIRPCKRRTGGSRKWHVRVLCFRHAPRTHGGLESTQREASWSGEPKMTWRRHWRSRRGRLCAACVQVGSARTIHASVA